MTDINQVDEEVFNLVRYAIVTVPGIVSFADRQTSDDKQLSTTDIKKAVNIVHSDEGITVFEVHLILMFGVNVKDVLNEVQIRVKYELEKYVQFSERFKVDVFVEDVACTW